LFNLENTANGNKPSERLENAWVCKVNGRGDSKEQRVVLVMMSTSTVEEDLEEKKTVATRAGEPLQKSIGSSSGAIKHSCSSSGAVNF